MSEKAPNQACVNAVYTDGSSLAVEVDSQLVRCRPTLRWGHADGQ